MPNYLFIVCCTNNSVNRDDLAFFRIPNEASEREWRGMCLQARQGGGSRQHVQTCGGHAQSITTSALPTLYQVYPMYKCIIELPSLAMNK